jgi:hypothetical protein
VGPGSPEVITLARIDAASNPRAGTMGDRMSDHTERLEDLAERIAAAKEFL